MSAKSSVEQVAQVGVEATPGVASAATWRPRSIDLSIQPTFEVGEVRAAGSYFTSSTYETSEASEGSAEGVPCFNELTHILPLVFGAPTSTALTAKVYRRVFKFNTTRRTWTVEHGDTAEASRAAFVHATGLSFEWGRNSGTATLNLSLGGGYFEDGVALTPAANVETMAVRPITALLVDVFSDTNPTQYGVTKLENAISTSVNLDNLAAGRQFLDTSKKSISTTVNTVPDANVELTLEANGAGKAWLGRLRTGETRYIRIAARGNIIDTVTTTDATGVATTTNHYEALYIDVPVQVVEVGERGDEDDIFAANYTLRMVDTGTSSLTVTLINLVPDPALDFDADGIPDAFDASPYGVVGTEAAANPADLDPWLTADKLDSDVIVVPLDASGNPPAPVALSTLTTTTILHRSDKGYVVTPTGARVNNGTGNPYSNSAIPDGAQPTV